MWSYALLSSSERAVLQCLSVFDGGWTLDAAEAVCTGDGLGSVSRDAVLDQLTSLVDKSLVICLPGKPSGALECLSFVVGAIPHCVEVLQEIPTSC